ncbi:MAG: serine/threonine-protein kinase, partial [Myxococcaceae bacterium]
MPCPDPSALDSLARGRLSPKAAAELGEHIRTCAACSKKHGQLAVQITLRDSGSGAPHPTADVGLLDTIRRPPSDPGTEVPTSTESAHPRGSTIGRYVILDRLGAGGMGIVYAAFDPDLDRKIALKILRADVLGSSAAKELRLRLLREAQAMARLSHPNVITVHDVGIVGEQVFAAMEFVDGQTLGEWSAEEPRSWRSTLEVYLKAGHGLAAAHEAGLVHRDFKPDNVLVGKDGRVRVLDFGLVHACTVPRKQDTPEPEPRPGEERGPMKRRITQPGTLLGTPAYMSPEQLLSKPTDTRSDQFSFCVALYEALFGERPFAAETAGALVAEITENRVRPEPRDSEVPGRIRRILLRGLRYDASERYRTMDALLIGLGRRRSTVRRRWLLFGAAALAATASLGLAIAIRSQAAGSCAAVADKLAGVWDPAVKAQAKAAFLASGTPYATKAFEEAARAVDLYTAAWVTERRQACEAARSRGDDAASSDEALGHRMVCLGRRLDDVQALGRLFVKADPEVVERAVPAALALPSLSGCAAPAASSRPSRDAASEEQAGLLRQKLADAKARLDAGKYAEGLALARESVDTARRLDDHAAEAEALYLVGALKLKTGDPKGSEAALSDAILAAEGSREDGLSARAWVELVGVVGASQARYDDGRERARHARAAL